MFATLDAIPRHWAAAAPRSIALVDGERRATWQELADSVDACASMLQKRAVRPGDRVVVAAENSVELVALLFAVTACKAAAVIVNPRLSAPELDGIVEHSQPRCIVFATATAAEVEVHAMRHAATPVELDALRVLAIATPRIVDARVAPDPGEVPASIVYTSGTSGRPKGVMLSHANLLFVASTSARLRRIDAGDRVLGALPIYHVYGLASMLLGSLFAGAALMLFARFDATHTLDAIAAGALTIVQGVPAMYSRMLVSLGPGGRVQSPSLRYLYAGGSPLDPTLKAQVESRFGMPLHNGYGLTECSPTVAQTRLDAPRADTSVGPPIPGIEVRIVDTSHRDVDAGAAGELWVRGPNVMRGYFRDPEATAQAITADGWLRTGDLATQAADGALFIVGRLKELIIRGGLNVYPGDIEAVLNAHPAVGQSVVVGRKVTDGDEEVVAFVELVADRTATEAELRAFAASRLAPYKRPSELRVLAALPASATGKVLRNELKRMAQRGDA